MSPSWLLIILNLGLFSVNKLFCIFDHFWLLYSSAERRSISLIDKNSFQFTCWLLKPDMKIMVMLILFLLYFFVLFNRSNDSCLLCCGAVRSRDSGRWMWWKRGAFRVCSGQKGYSLLSAGGDSSTCPWLLPKFSCTSPRSVKNTFETSTVLCLFISSIP